MFTLRYEVNFVYIGRISFPGQNIFDTNTSKALNLYRGADKSLARPGMKQVTATEGFDFHLFYS
jgi:hypothetical protein